MNRKKIGILISYLNLAVGMIVNIYLTPFLIVTLGDVDYSLYKVMQSFAGPLGIFQLGIAGVVTRSIVRCKNSVDYSEKDKQNTMALSMLASGAMALIVMAIAAVMYGLIPSMYSQSYTEQSVAVGQKIFLIFVAATVTHMLTDAFSGCIMGHERYIASASIPLLKTIGKGVLLIVLLKCGLGVVYVVLVDLILALGVLAASAFLALTVLKEVPRLTYFDKAQLKEILLFGMAILLQAFVNQVNNNVDTMILGALIQEKYIITMYSSALAIYCIYNSLISVVTGFFLPEATKLLTLKASGKELTDFVIRPGRFQAVVAVACICGFGLFGKNFITIWIGSSYLEAYGVILALMIPVTIPLVENAVISILDAAMKRIFRSIVLVIMAVLNIAVSIVLVKMWGYWGAAVGTALSLIVGHGILMNAYYAKEFGIEVFRMFREIFRGILPAGLAAALLCLPLSLFVPDTTVMFIVKCVCYVGIYGLLLCLFGLRPEEKGVFRSVVKRFAGK